MHRRLTSAVLGGALAAALTLTGGYSASAQVVDGDLIEVDVDGNGANALLEAFYGLDLELDDLDIDVIELELENSLNNLQALNNVLNNNDVLNDIEVDIQDVDVLTDFEVEILEDILEQVDIDIDDVVAVDFLDNGDVLIIVD